MIEVGIATAAISVERQFRMNDEHDERREDATQDQVLLHGMERFLDELRLVARVGDLESPAAASVCNSAMRSLIALDYIERVGAGLLADLEHHRRRAVQARERARLFIAVDHLADIGDANRASAHVGHHDALKVLRVRHAAQRAERQLARRPDRRGRRESRRSAQRAPRAPARRSGCRSRASRRPARPESDACARRRSAPGRRRSATRCSS